MRINRHDTNGTKPLLGKGELGYDDYVAGGDVGRVYVGTGSENIALAERLESNMMTKAQFNALAEERKANRAGSGLEDYGKTFLDVSGAWVGSGTKINEGLYTPPIVSAYNNSIYTGTRSMLPIVSINGYRQKLSFINENNADLANKILLPTAPNIYPYDATLTAEQIASGVIKHADASNSGLIVNGKFDVDTSGWTANNATLSVENNKLKIVDGGVYSAAKQSFTTVIGKKYIIEFDVTNNTDGRYLCGVHSSSTWNGTSVTNILYADEITSTTGSTRKSYEFVATSTTSMLMVGQIGTVTCYFDNIAVFPADAISRSDLVFLESWHEDVSEKNFVYPLGNVQYLGGNTDGLTGITNGNFTGFETYSLFGNWQTPSALIGKGYVWSNLTEVQKRAFIANPENNCYLDGDKTIQVRYRVRVVMGWSDSWASIDTQSSTALLNVSGVYVAPRGKRVEVIDNGSGTQPITNSFYVPVRDSGNRHPSQLGLSTDNNGYWSIPSNLQVTGFAYEGKCFALPIALVHRRNQGIYHNSYNPNGAKKASDGNFWYNTAVNFTSISDCFDPSKLLTASGYIGTVSGRPDGLFYDQVHEGDILDLRNSSKKVEDYNRLINREFNKLVAGTTRGKEGEYYSIDSQIKTPNSYEYSSGAYSRFQFPVGTFSRGFGAAQNSTFYNFGILNVSGKNYIIIAIRTNEAGYDRVYLNINHGNLSGLWSGAAIITIQLQTTRTKSNTLLHCDIIGNPTNYPTAWKESGVFGTPLIVAEDGASLLPDGTKDTFKLSRKANATPLLCLRSTDSGATWTSLTPTFSTTTNEITLTNEPAGNLVMVYYQTHTSMAIPVVNSEVIEIGDVIATNGNGFNALSQSLISKILVGTANNNYIWSSSLTQKGIGIGNLFNTSLTSPTHITPLMYGVTNPAVKVFPYLTRLNGKAYLNLVFKEMKHNGTSWGDDSKFNIVDNVSTTTDNNAQTVLIGQKTVELPYFIGAGE